MTELRNDSRVFGYALGALAAAAICVAGVTAAADDMEPPVDPVLAAIDASIVELSLDKKEKKWRQTVPAPTVQVVFDPEKTYYWNLDTNKGDIKIELFPQSAPLHVLSTIYLTRLGFYDDLKFHRIIKDFMAQGGDPLGNGTGGPGYMYGDEFDEALSHDKKGVVSMANAGSGTDGSQFFITFGPAKRLDGKHTIFGEVVDGIPAVNKLERAGTEGGKPRRKVFIKKATITVE